MHKKDLRKILIEIKNIFYKRRYKVTWKKWMEPKEGLLTFRAEGNNVLNSQYYSRKIHWPGNSLQCENFASGVTIGRGYDLKYRSSGEIIHDLTFS